MDPLVSRSSSTVRKWIPLVEFSQQLRQVRQAAADAVELVASQRVAFGKRGKRFFESRAIVATAGGFLDKDVLALHSKFLGGIDLQTWISVTGRDAGVEPGFGHLLASDLWQALMAVVMS